MPGVEGGFARRLQRNHTLYLSLLSRCVEAKDPLVNQLLQAAAADNWVDAQRYAHSLKSVAATIGLVDLASEATLLEQLCQQQLTTGAASTNNDMVAALQRLTQQWQQLQAEIAPLLQIFHTSALAVTADTAAPLANLAAGTTSEQVPQPDPQQLHGAINQLCQLLADADGDAVSSFADQQSYWRQTFPKQYPLLQSLIENFDFDQALSLIRQLRAEAERVNSS